MATPYPQASASPIAAQAVPSLEHTDIVVDGVRVRVHTAGSGPALVLVHGLFVSHLEWLDVLPYLAKHFRCIVPDLPGFGNSDRPADFPYGWEGYAGHLSKLLPALGLTSANVCGHSMGGGIALTFAGMHPAMVERLAVIDAAAYSFPIPLKGKIPLVPGLGSVVFKKLYGRALFRDYFQNEVWNGSPDLDLERVADYYNAFDRPGGRDAAYSAFKRTVDPSPVGKHVPNVAAKTLVLWGRDDLLIPLDVGRKLADNLRDAHLTILDDCGHAPNEQMPERTARILIEHFSDEPQGESMKAPTP